MNGAKLLSPVLSGVAASFTSGPHVADTLDSAVVGARGGEAGRQSVPYFLFFARPLVPRVAPRPRAVLPLAPAERFPVSFEKASMILPAILSTVPSALSRDPDFMACRPFHGQSAA